MDGSLRGRPGGVYFTRLSAVVGQLRHVKNAAERQFLEAVERGDMPTVSRMVAGEDQLDINCTDMLGRTALLIAVDNENFEMVELLLRNDAVITGSALIHAIVEGSYKIVELIVQHPSIQREMLSRPLAAGQASGAPPGVSPIMMAAQCNQFEILQLFLSYGAFISHPHVYTCRCRTCTRENVDDCLGHSLKRIQTYRALTSAAWISLTSEDPILEAFKLSWELSQLSCVENEFQQVFLHMSDQCKRYACDLLDQCRTSEEVLAVLNRKTPGEDCGAGRNGDGSPVSCRIADNCDPARNTPTLPRLSLAIKYKQKQFVAHPHSQHILMNVWYAGLPLWRGRNPLAKIALCTFIILCIPLIAGIYLLFPHSRLGRAIKTPFMKFIYHSSSFCFFLLLLVAGSLLPHDDSQRAKNIRGSQPSIVEWLVAIWVLGMVWGECKQLWDEGFREYVLQWWNWLDFIMLTIYISSFMLKTVAFFQIQSGVYGCRELDRMKWPSTDPTLISEGLFSVASVFSFSRIIYLFQTNPHLGPLQISLGCMIIDIIKFLFIFFLILTSFACGLNQLFWYYTNDSSDELFGTIATSYSTLLWSLFGQIPVRTLAEQRHQRVTHLLGQVLLAAYLIMAVTVMVNMLIAMMSRSFQIVEDHADREWKFARSKLWMSYFDEGSTLPSPFNVIISPKWLRYTGKGARQFCRVTSRALRRIMHALQRHVHRDNTVVTVVQPSSERCTQSGVGDSIKHDSVRSKCSTVGRVTPKRLEIEQPGPYEDIFGHEDQASYSDIIRLLVSRYIMNFKNQHRRSGANEDDFMEIKQDISSLRYELREDRKREVSRNYRYMDGIRAEIVEAIRGPPGARLAPQAEPAKGYIWRRSQKATASFRECFSSQNLSLDLGQLSRCRPEGQTSGYVRDQRTESLSVSEQATLRRLLRHEIQLELSRQKRAELSPNHAHRHDKHTHPQTSHAHSEYYTERDEKNSVVYSKNDMIPSFADISTTCSVQRPEQKQDKDHFEISTGEKSDPEVVSAAKQGNLSRDRQMSSSGPARAREIGARERRRAIFAGQSFDCSLHYLDIPKRSTRQPPT